MIISSIKRPPTVQLWESGSVHRQWQIMRENIAEICGVFFFFCSSLQRSRLQKNIFRSLIFQSFYCSDTNLFVSQPNDGVQYILRVKVSSVELSEPYQIRKTKHTCQKQYKGDCKSKKCLWQYMSVMTFLQKMILCCLLNILQQLQREMYNKWY